MSNNQLVGSIPEGVFGLPWVNIIDLADNQITGSLSREIGKAKNMSEFLAQNNKLTGILPAEISGAIKLVKIDVSNNLLFGAIADKLGKLKKLNFLLLHNNNFTSTIPLSFSKLKSVNVLDFQQPVNRKRP